MEHRPDCEACSLCESAEHVGLMGQGPVPAVAMIVGEAPGHREDEIGKPFQGRAGQLLDDLLKECDLARDEIFITNALKCRPPQNRTPTVSEIKSCNSHLRDELSMVKPKFCLLLGNVAFKSVLGRSGITKHRGEVFERDGVSYLVTLHPAAVLRMPHLRASLLSDLRRFKRLMEGTIEDVDLNWHLVDTPAKFTQAMKELYEAEAVSYDVETSGFNPRTNVLYTLGLATERAQFIIPVDFPGSKFSGKGELIVRTVAKVLAGKKLIAHNSKFDNKWLKHYGWDVPTTFDTMLASYILDENAGHSLKNLAKIYFNAPAYELMQPIDTDRVRLEELAKYNAYDVYYTMKLYREFRDKLLEDRGLLKVFKYLLMPTMKALEGVEELGVYLDRDQLTAATDYARRTVDQLVQDLTTAVGHEINWNSPLQVAVVLYQELGLPVLEYTKTGNPSTAESVLLRLRNDSDVVASLLKYREWTKLSQFLASWTEKIDENGRMHPSFLVHGTVTGRLSCRDPNLQQVPRDPFLRSIITEPEGWSFVEADYSQVELRVAAMLSGDDSLKLAFQTGQDVHRKTASVTMGVPEDEVTKADRKKAKAVNFGFLYGMGAKKFQIYARDKYDVHISIEEAEAFRRRFFDLYNGLPSWHERQRRIVKKYGYVRTPMGRKRRLPDIDSPDKYLRGEAERQAINSPVQSFASDLTLYSMVRLVQSLPSEEFRVVGLVHDALLMAIKTDALPRILPEVKRVMEDRAKVKEVFGYDITVPLEVEIKVGPWGKGEIYEL